MNTDDNDPIVYARGPTVIRASEVRKTPSVLSGFPDGMDYYEEPAREIVGYKPGGGRDPAGGTIGVPVYADDPDADLWRDA